MERINLNTINENIEDFIFAKRDIENIWIEQHKIEERSNLIDFVLNMNLENNIFMYKGSVIPFKLIKGKKDKYLFYTVSNMDTAENDLKVLENYLSKIKYDLTSLKKQDLTDLMDTINSIPVFIINNDYYV